MSRRLRVNTRAKVDKSSTGCRETEELEPMSPLTECMMLSDGIKMANIIILESQDTIHVSPIYDLLQDKGLAIHPRFSSIPVRDNGKTMWKKVEVNVKDHVEIPVLPEGLSIESYDRHFEEYLNKVANDDIRIDKPLWEVHLFKYPIKNNAAGVIIFKVDHAIADGISLMGTMFSLFQRSDDPSLPLTFPTSKSLKKKHQTSQTITKIVQFFPKVVSCFFDSLSEFGHSLWLTAFADDRTPIRSGNSELRPVSIRICSVALSLHDVKKIKTILGVTLNDVLAGIVSLGTRLYMREINQGKIVKSRSTAVIPVNIRKQQGYSYASPEEMRKVNTKVPWGNRISSVEIPIHNIDYEDLTNPLLIVMKAHRTIQRKRAATLAHLLFDGIISAIKICGGAQAVARIMERKWTNSSIGILNMMGPTNQISLASHRISDGYFMTAWNKQTLIVSMASYVDKLRICLSFEQGFVDQQKLTASIENAFQMIYKAAMASSPSS